MKNPYILKHHLVRCPSQNLLIFKIQYYRDLKAYKIYKQMMAFHHYLAVYFDYIHENLDVLAKCFDYVIAYLK